MVSQWSQASPGLVELFTFFLFDLFTVKFLHFANKYNFLWFDKFRVQLYDYFIIYKIKHTLMD